MPAKVAVITGASDGIGEQAAIKLKAAGWQLAAIGRNPERTEALGQALQTPWYIADFSSLQEVSALAVRLRHDWPRIDALINNAGGMFPRGKKTRDGHETTFQVNHLAHFLLTRLLMDRLLSSRASVINTSSMAHRPLGFLYRPGQPEKAFWGSTHLAYGNAKLANILFTRELHRRYHSQGLSAAAVHPGVVATSFSRNTLSPMRLLYDSALSRLPVVKTSAQGADTLVRLAQGTPGIDWVSGGYYSGFRQAVPSRMAKSDAAARALWKMSEKAVEGFL
ncbi:MAG: SDR family NAD(P)-dependent oxidoreductase [Eubacteriales bacterium]|nr:SDR family NAD(P)-dependent oxidoreductase [Eubacteriales bacterium]